MRKLPRQTQTLQGTIEYEFEVSKLLNGGDTIASVDWELPEQLTLVQSVVSGTKVRAFIQASGTAKLYDSYWVSFTVNSVGNPTPVNPELSFEIYMAKRIVVDVI